MSIQSDCGPTVIFNQAGNITSAQILLTTIRSITVSHPQCNIIVLITPITLDDSIILAQSISGIDIILSSPYQYYSPLKVHCIIF